MAAITDPLEFDLYINAIKVNTSSVTLEGTFIDSDTNDHVIGKSYSGFIYHMCIYQYEYEPIVEIGLCDNDQCVNCPAGKCIYECSKDQYYETDTCADCADTCDTGC